MSTLTLATLNIQQAGSSPVGFFEQQWIVSGSPSPITVYVQGGALVDPDTGQPSVIDTNGLHVVPSIGTPALSGPVSNTNIAPGVTATLPSPTPVTTGKTGSLQHAIFASTQPMLWALQTVNNAGTPANVTTFITDTNRTFEFRAVFPTEVLTVLSNGAAIFQATAQNIGTNAATPAAAYASFAWAEN